MKFHVVFSPPLVSQCPLPVQPQSVLSCPQVLVIWEKNPQAQPRLRAAKRRTFIFEAGEETDILVKPRRSEVKSSEGHTQTETHTQA